MKVRPLHDRIMVERLEEQEVKRGGIIIPDTAKEKPQEGKVSAVGTGKVGDDGIEAKVGRPTITKRGDTVAKEIELKDKYDNIGAQMVREVAAKTSDVAGDGTTTATVLAQAIFREGLKNVTAGANPMGLKRGI